jgi:hypothetical protein
MPMELFVSCVGDLAGVFIYMIFSYMVHLATLDLICSPQESITRWSVAQTANGKIKCEPPVFHLELLVICATEGSYFWWRAGSGCDTPCSLLVLFGRPWELGSFFYPGNFLVFWPS